MLISKTTFNKISTNDFKNGITVSSTCLDFNTAPTTFTSLLISQRPIISVIVASTILGA